MFKVLDGATAPKRATKYSAMVDLYANADVVIGAGETKIVPLGVKINLEELRFNEQFEFGEIIDGIFKLDNETNIKANMAWNLFRRTHFIELHPRSSLRAKGLIVGVGVVDLDYPDELGLIVHNPINMVFVEPIEQGDEYVDISLTGSNYGAENPNIKSQGRVKIKQGDKIAQCTIVEHKGYLMGIESKVERSGGFGSTDKDKK